MAEGRTLVIDTATAACSVALFAGERLLGHGHELIGRGHAERLVPMIASLPHRGEADRIHVAAGPGSFTGIRVGIAAARALGLAWNADVSGFPSLPAMAALAQGARPDCPALAILTSGGHGEFFVQLFDDGRSAAGWEAARSLSPDRARDAVAGRLVAGDAGDRIDLPGSARLELFPDARGWLLFRSHATLPPRPIYGRAPDAAVPTARAGA